MSDVPIREYIDTRLKEMDKRLEERFQAQEKAMSLAVAQSHWELVKTLAIVGTAISVVSLLVALAALFWKH